MTMLALTANTKIKKESKTIRKNNYNFMIKHFYKVSYVKY